jgi:hypothetical protein
LAAVAVAARFSMSNRIAPWRWIVALFGLSFGLGALLAIFGSMSQDAGPLVIALMVAIVIGLCALALWLTAMYWRRIDEAAREAHKWAWFWGGNIALLPAVMGFVLLMERPDLGTPLWPGLDPTPAHYVVTGGILVVFLLLIGYGLAWVGWWLWKGR